MRKIVLYLTVSVDGFIARKHDCPKLIDSYTNLKANDREFSHFYDTVETLLMGGNTYQEILCNERKWPFDYKVSYVVSQHTTKNCATADIRFITDDVINHIKDLKEKEGGNIWLVGGGQLISSLLNYNLIDEMSLLYIPTLLSEGIPLFSRKYEESQWHLLESHFYENGTIMVRYGIKI